MKTSNQIKNRLEYLRQELRAGKISYGELVELQSLTEYIEPGDVELLEAAGVPEIKTIEYHRNPTPYEIKFGEGATHYMDFELSEVTKQNGDFKQWIKADDGLRYYRL